MPTRVAEKARVRAAVKSDHMARLKRRLRPKKAARRRYSIMLREVGEVRERKVERL